MKATTRAALALTAPLVAMLPLASHAAAAPLHCQGHVATIVAPKDGGVVRGTPGADVIYARNGAVVRAGAGDDLVCGHGRVYVKGGAGDDRIIGGKRGGGRLYGGPGDDTIVAESSSTVGGDGGNDKILNAAGSLFMRDEPGHDRVVNRAASPLYFSLRGSPTGVDVDLSGRHPHLRDEGTVELRLGPATHVAVVGTEHSDQLRGSALDDNLMGLGGSDLIQGRGGDDQLDGGKGAYDDTVLGGAGNDLIVVRGESTADGGTGNDTIRVDGHDAAANGGDGDDTVSVSDLVPGLGPSVDLGPGDNRLSARIAPPATPTGTWARVSVDLTSGRVDADGEVSDLSGLVDFLFISDRVVSRAAASWDIIGTSGPDSISVVNYEQAPGPVTVHALDGDDVVATGPGDDTIDGGPGNDRAYAGAGNDTCISTETQSGCETVTP